MKTKTINGTYGSEERATEVYTLTKRNGVTWYCCHDSVNVNATLEDLEDGVNVELVSDVDCCTAQEPIRSEEELDALLNE